MDVDGVAVDELEPVLAPVLESLRRDAEFLLDFAGGTFERRLAWFQAPPRAVHLAGAQAAFLSDQEHLAVFEDEGQSGPVDGVPGRPVDVAELRPAGGLLHAGIVAEEGLGLTSGAAAEAAFLCPRPAKPRFATGR